MGDYEREPGPLHTLPVALPHSTIGVCSMIRAHWTGLLSTLPVAYSSHWEGPAHDYSNQIPNDSCSIHMAQHSTTGSQ